MTDHYSMVDRHEIIEALNRFLADTAIVYFKTHAFHWNVEGDTFYSSHIMFEKFYTKLWKSLDDVAERIRALGEKAPPSFGRLLEWASIQEAETTPKSHIMMKILRDDYIALAIKAHEVCAIAEKSGDLITTDMMTEKAAFLEKAAWMLLSSTID